MSKGSPIVQLRVPVRLLQEIDEAIRQRNDYTKDVEWTRSSFFVSAANDKLAKMERSRRKKKRPAPLVETLELQSTLPPPGPADQVEPADAQAVASSV